MECPLCQGTGEVPEKHSPEEKAEIAALLVEKGFSYGAIAQLLGWKSKNSVTHALRTPQKTQSNN